MPTSKLDPYQVDILAALAAGMSQRELALTYNVARSTLQNKVNQWQALPMGPPAVGDNLHEGTTDPDGPPIFIRDYRHLEHLHVYPLGDLHLGSPKCAVERLDEWLAYLLHTDGVSLLNTGDNTNCAIIGSKSEVYDDVLSLGQAREILTIKFEPLAAQDKIDAIIDGNHEDRVYRATGDSPNAAVASALGIGYSRAACVVRYLVGNQQYDCYLRHGTGGGQTMGAAVNRLQKQEHIIDADVYVSGHSHTQVCFPKNIFIAQADGSYRRKKRLFVCGGSFLYYEDYACKAGMPPAHIGAPRIFLDGTRHDLHGSV